MALQLFGRKRAALSADPEDPEESRRQGGAPGKPVCDRPVDLRSCESYGPQVQCNADAGPRVRENVMLKQNRARTHLGDICRPNSSWVCRNRSIQADPVDVRCNANERCGKFCALTAISRRYAPGRNV